MLSFSEAITIMRLHYHANIVDLFNGLNQIHLVSDDTAERICKKHTMICINDIGPRMKNIKK